MRKPILTALTLAVLACAAANAQKTFTVSNMDQFLRAVGPDRTIALKPGTYTVKKSSNVKNQYFRWDDVGGGDFQLTIQEVSGLTIKAQSSDVGIVAATAYAYVLAFESCQSIRLEGLTLGHEASEPCMAGVLSFQDSNDVTVESCDLYGSGANGINSYGCDGLYITGTTIRDCSYNAAYFSSTTGISFDACTISANAAYPLFYLDNVDGVAFTGCQIASNSGDQVLTVGGDILASVDFTECTFDYNEIGLFCEPGTEIYITDGTFEGNDFGDDPDAIVDAVSGATSDVEGYEGEEEVAEPWVYTFEPAGLSFLVPANWEPMESDDGESLKIAHTESETGVILSAVYNVPAGGNIEKNAKRYLDEGLKGFIALMKKEDATASVKLDGDVFDIEGLPAADFRGAGKYDGTEDLLYWVRLVISNGKVWGIIGVSDQEEALAEESDMATLMDSFSLAPGGE